MKTKQTFGNWTIDEKSNQIQENGATIVLMWGKTATKKHQKLIAAAPELLEALQLAVSYISRFSKVPDELGTKDLKIISEAIKKANE